MMSQSSLRQGVRYLELLLPVLLFVLLFLTQNGQLAAEEPNWISQAEDRLRQGDREGALKAFQQAAWQRPQDPRIHYNMGVLAESLGRLGEAAGHYAAYLRWAPEAADRETVKRKVFQLCGELAAQAYRNRQYLQALDWYDKARELFPYAKAVYFNLSRVYEARGDWEKAAASLKEYHTLCDPKERGPVKERITGYFRKAAETRFEEGDYDGALARYQEAARWDPEDSRLLLNQALCEEKLGLFEEAKNHYLAYLQVDPMTRQRDAILDRVVRLHVLLAEQHLDQGHLSRAEDILEKGTEIDPENPDLYSLLARTSLGLGQPEQAVAYLERILELTSEEKDRRPYVEELVRLCVSLADTAYRKQAYPDALRFLKKAMYWAPDNTLVAYNLARVYERQKEWEQAILAYRRYLYLDPDAAERNEVKAKLAYYYSFLGTERFEREEYPQAQEAFEQALLVRPEDQALLYNLATVLLKRGKMAEALPFLERYLKYERNPEEVERVRRQITQLASLTEQKRRRKSGKSVATGLEVLEEKEGGLAGDALGDRKNAYLLLQAGQWREALEKYEACLRRVPGMGMEEGFRRELASAYREISRAALVDGNMNEALETLEKAREWAPAEAFPYLWKGKVYEHRGDVEQALSVYRESLRHVRGEPGRQTIRSRIVAILTQRLLVALRNNRLPEALRTMSDLEPYLGETQARDVHYQKARIEGALGQKERALVEYGLHLVETPQSGVDPRIREELLPLIEGDPDLLASIENPSDAYSRAQKSAAQGDAAKALFCFLLARGDAGHPRDLDAAILRSLQALGMEDEALSLLSRPSDGSKPFVLPKAQGGQLLRSMEPVLWDDYRTGNYERGLETIRSLRSGLGEPGGRLSLLEGVFEEMMGQDENAIHRYEAGLHSGTAIPGERIPPVTHRLCALLIRKALNEYEAGDYEACIESLKRAESVVPGRADVAFDLGCAYLRLKNPQEALKAFSRYLEIVLEESPRKQLTSSAVLLLQRQLARAPVVRYDGKDIAVDLIFERPGSLGHLLAQAREGDGEEELLDSVVLAPYLDVPAEGEAIEEFPVF